MQAKVFFGPKYKAFFNQEIVSFTVNGAVAFYRDYFNLQV